MASDEPGAVQYECTIGSQESPLFRMVMKMAKKPKPKPKLAKGGSPEWTLENDYKTVTVGLHPVRMTPA
jgi:hypothetical protein